ncbi:MAG TPA: hypothetical protein VIR79_01385 [Nitrospira sp.]
MKIAKPPDQTSAMLSCPKCGFEQEGGTECLRCGIVFAKYKPPVMTADVDVAEPDSTLSPPSTVKPAQPTLLSGLLRILPWISLAVTATVLLLILKQTPPLTIQSDPEAANRVADKMAQLQLAMQSNQRHATTLDEAELNQWMRENLAIASAHEAQQAGIDIPAGQQATVKDVQSALKDVRMNLIGNQLRAYALFVMYGKDVSLQLDGTLETQGGYIRLKPTAGKIGSLPIPSSTLDRVVHELFNSPQNRENFQLPPQIESVRVEQNSLVITTR